MIFQQSVGLGRNISLLLAGFNGIAYFFSSLPPIWILDRLGRRKLMLFAAAGQCVCMAVLAGTVSNGSKSAGIVAVVMLFLFYFFFAIGLLAIPWLLPAEYAPLAIRTKAAALASASNWIFTFLVVEITPISIQNVGWRTYVYFCVFNAFFLPLIYFFYPETRNLSLEQVRLTVLPMLETEDIAVRHSADLYPSNADRWPFRWRQGGAARKESFDRFRRSGAEARGLCGREVTEQPSYRQGMKCDKLTLYAEKESGNVGRKYDGHAKHQARSDIIST